MTLAISLKARRLDLGLTIAQAAKEIGVTRMTLQRAESGERVPRPGAAFKIAAYHGFKVTEVWPLDAPDEAAA